MFESIVQAFGWGAFSALSLPLGAALGLMLKPKQKLNSAFMAFGAGALLFALTIELFGHIPHHVQEHGMGSLYASLAGAILGGILFEFLNTILNDRGAFLRKFSQIKRHFTLQKKEQSRKLIDQLSRVYILNELDEEQMKQLISNVKLKNFNQGQMIFDQGEDADDMYFILEGEVEISVNGGQQIAILKQYDTFGELGILLHQPRTARAVAKTDVSTFRINMSDFQDIIEGLPKFQESLKKLAEERISDLSVKTNHKVHLDSNKILSHLNVSVSEEEMLEGVKAAGATGGAALAIWLGILIDGIPESLIIGMMALQDSGMSIAFIAGVFLANLPEAMSSAVSMKKGGMGLKKIMWMWGSLCLMTGIGAGLGSVIFPAHPTGGLYYLVISIEGLAAGAMLTMIAETMLPEAFEEGGRVVGMSTLLGFLVALIVKVF